MRYNILRMLLICILPLNGMILNAQLAEPADSTLMPWDETVKVLYGEQQYSKFVGNMNSVNNEDLQHYPAMSVLEALAGKLPGFFILQQNGNPGDANFTSFIRGNNKGYIFIIDGVERSLTYYDINQIDEVKVLKDPVSKALYGGRVTNGIVLISTKRGQVMKGQFKVNVQRGQKAPTRLPDYLNAYDFARFYNQALANDNGGVIPDGQGYNQEALDAYKNHTSPYKYPDVDYYDQFLKSSMDITRISAEYSGGSQKTKYYFHLGYQNEGGLEAYGEKKRRKQTVNLQGNLDADFSKEIKLHMNYAGYYGNKTYPAGFNISTLSERYPNAYPIFVAPDSVGGTSSWKDNPYGGQVQSGYTIENQVGMQADIGLEFHLDKLVKGLSFKPVYSFDIHHRQNLDKKNTVGIYQISSFDDEGNPLTITEIQKEQLATNQSMGGDYYNRTWAFNGTLSYERQWNNHAIESDLVYYIMRQTVVGSYYDYKRQNLGLRLNYAYAGKYIAEGVLNYTGSDNYSPGNRFKFYPAVGLGWVISKEEFMKKFSFINYLKLNASWGIMGEGKLTNSDGAITPYRWTETWSQLGSAYFFNASSSANTGYLSQIANHGLKWPKLREIDISLEANMFNSLHWKLSYFDYLSSDELSQRANITPSYLGGGRFLPLSNFGKNSMKGIEFEVSYAGKINKLGYQIGGHMTYSRNKRVQVDELADPDYSIKGDALDQIRGYQAIGTYTQADIDKVLSGDLPQPSYMSPKELRVGNIMYKDINKDGTIDKYDQVRLGNSSPRLMYSGNINLNYKGFELYAQLTGYGSFDRNLMHRYYQIYRTNKYSKVLVDGLPNGNPHPPLSTGQSQNDFLSSSWWVVNGGFLKLQNVSLSYSLPKRIISRWSMSDLKLTLYGTDLLTFSKIKDLDPESLDAGVYNYPLFSTYAIGLSVTF